VKHIHRQGMLWTLAFALASMIPAGACLPFGDPEGAGVSGTISWGSDVEFPAGLARLEIRAFPLKSDADPELAIPQPTTECDEVCSEVLSQSTPFTPLISWKYVLLKDLGNTEFEVWRVVAWLSKEDFSVAPEVGDLVATATFKVSPCGEFGGFCGITSGVDLTLSELLP
jgi:hypothetical protein